MVVIGLFFLFSVCFFAATIGLQVYCKKARALRFAGLELRPNCLLTRYPIVFISSRRSIFRLFEHWNDIPVYLREHGYEVIVIEPLSAQDYGGQIARALDEIAQPFHLIADSSSRIELENIARNRHPKAMSLTLIQSTRRKEVRPQAAKALRPDDLKPRGLAIEIFELCPLSEMHFSPLGLFSLGLLRAHNLVFLGRDRAIDFLEIAELDSTTPFEIETRFLELAISLAERDMSRDTIKDTVRDATTETLLEQSNDNFAT